jgi:hypothetical protein
LKIKLNKKRNEIKKNKLIKKTIYREKGGGALYLYEE